MITREELDAEYEIVPDLLPGQPCIISNFPGAKLPSDTINGTVVRCVFLIQRNTQ